LILAARLFSRWPWRTLLGYDDLVTSVATVCLHRELNFWFTRTILHL
jgi:hypothetical protein